MDNVIRLFGTNTVPRSFTAKVRFKTRPKFGVVTIPQLGRHHCDMDAMRRHSKLGAYANSDLFTAMLRRHVAELLGKNFIDLNSELPAGVTWTGTGDYMATVTIDLGA